MKTQGEVVKRLCQAVKNGREASSDWTFSSDCFCKELKAVWTFQYSEDFLQHLERSIEAAARSYIPPKI